MEYCQYMLHAVTHTHRLHTPVSHTPLWCYTSLVIWNLEEVSARYQGIPACDYHLSEPLGANRCHPPVLDRVRTLVTRVYAGKCVPRWGRFTTQTVAPHHQYTEELCSSSIVHSYDCTGSSFYIYVFVAFATLFITVPWHSFAYQRRKLCAPTRISSTLTSLLGVVEQTPQSKLHLYTQLRQKMSHQTYLGYILCPLFI